MNIKRYTSISEAKAMLEEKLDADMREMVKEEVTELRNAQEELEEKLKILLIPKDPNDDKNVIMEIRGAAGGDEAALFAGDLYRMYSRFAECTRLENGSHGSERQQVLAAIKKLSS